MFTAIFAAVGFRLILGPDHTRACSLLGNFWGVRATRCQAVPFVGACRSYWGGAMYVLNFVRWIAGVASVVVLDFLPRCYVHFVGGFNCVRGGYMLGFIIQLRNRSFCST